MKTFVENTAIILGLLIGGYVGYLIGDNFEITKWLTIPFGSFLAASILYGFSDSFFMRKFRNLPVFENMISEIKTIEEKLTIWEEGFFKNIQEEIVRNPEFIYTTATTKQIRSIINIYLERVRGVDLEGKEFEIQIRDKYFKKKIKFKIGRD